MKIRNDLQMISKGSKKKAIATILTNPCFHSVVLFRISSFFYHKHLSPIAKLVWYINRLMFSVDIDYRADIAGGFALVHGLGTVIGHEVISKGKLVVYQQVTIGGNQGRTMDLGDGMIISQPFFEDDVKVYSGASIYGPVYLKSGSVIKAGSVVTEKTNVE